MLLDAWPMSSSKWPVIVIDEANKLMGWDKYPADLDTLLSYFVQITKQANRCHVLMATSEYGFQIWMNKGNLMAWPDAIFCLFEVMSSFKYAHDFTMFMLLLAIGSGFWAPEVIGDFQEDEARKFLEEELRQGQSSVTVDDNAWKKIYEVRLASIQVYL